MDPVPRFAEIVRRPEPEIPLDEGALLISRCAQPGLDIDTQLGRLDALAGDVHDATLTGVLRLLFREMGCTGNRVDYYDPRNSYLDVVLDRRLGIPISLAVLTIEIGRRAGVPLVGVGLPGHFLVRDVHDDDLFIDVFAGGRVLDSRECQVLFRRLHGAAAPFHDSFLAPIGRDHILQRMTGNLRGVFVQRNDTRSLAWVLELLTQFPDAGADTHRELGAVQRANGAFDRAAAAFERAAALAAAAETDPASDLADALALRARCN